MSNTEIQILCKRYGVQCKVKKVVTQTISGHYKKVKNIIITNSILKRLIRKMEKSDKKSVNGRDISIAVDRVISKLKKELK